MTAIDKLVRAQLSREHEKSSRFPDGIDYVAEDRLLEELSRSDFLRLISQATDELLAQLVPGYLESPVCGVAISLNDQAIAIGDQERLARSIGTALRHAGDELSTSKPFKLPRQSVDLFAQGEIYGSMSLLGSDERPRPAEAMVVVALTAQTSDYGVYRRLDKAQIALGRQLASLSDGIGHRLAEVICSKPGEELSCYGTAARDKLKIHMHANVPAPVIEAELADDAGPSI